MRTTGNTILITGGGSGIGAALAVHLHRAGNTVIVAGRRRARLEALAAAHPGIAAVPFDVTEPESVSALAAQVTDRFPELNVLVNNAGIQQREDLAGGKDLAVAERIVATNLLGPIRVLDAFLPQLLARDPATVVNVTSGLAFVPWPSTPTYSATKAALHSFTDSLRVQLAGTTVEVLGLAPPLIATDLMGQRDNPNAMPVEDFVTEVMQLLSRPAGGEVLVERVLRQRRAEAGGRYAEVLAAQSAFR